MAAIASREASQGDLRKKNEINTNANAGVNGISQAWVNENSAHMFVTSSSYHFSQSISSTDTVPRPV